MAVNIGSQTVSGGAKLGVANALQQWADQKNREIAQRSLQAAREEGQQTEVQRDEKGQLVKPEERKGLLGGLIGGKTAEQYNKGARDAYIISVDRDNTQEVNRIAQESDGDLDYFDKVINQYRNTVMGNVDPVAQGDIRASLDFMIGRGRTAVQKVAISRQIQTDKEERWKAFNDYADESSRLTRNGELQGAQENILKARLTLDSMVESGDITRAKADELFLESKKEIFRQGFKKEVIDLAQEDIGKANARLNELEKEVPKDYTPDQWEIVIDDIRADVNRIRSRVVGKAGGSLKEAKQFLKDAKQSLQFGFVISNEDKINGARLVSGTVLEDEYRRLLKMESFAVMPHADRSQILQAMSQTDNLAAQQEFMALSGIHQKINNMAEDDGYGLAVRQGLITPTELDLSDPGTLMQRAEEAEQLSALYGTAVSPLMETEVEALVNRLPEMTPSEKSDLALSLGGNESIFRQIDKKNGSVFAMVGAIGDKDIANAIFTGQELLKTKQVKPPSSNDYLVEAEDYLGGVGEVYGVNDRNTVIRAALDYYAATTDDPTVFKANDFQDALEMVTGGIAKINGRKIELPRGVTDDDFEDFVDELQPQTLEAMGGLLMPNLEVEDVRDAQFISQGNGEYLVEIGGQPQLNKSGEPLIFRYTQELVELNEVSKPKRTRRRR